MRDKILKLLAVTLTPYETSVQGITGHMRAQLAHYSSLQPLSEEDEQKQEQAIQRFADALLSKKGEVQDAIATIYETVFTEAEVDAMLAYQESAVAEKMRQVTPELMDQINLTTAKIQGPAIEGINEELSSLLNSINAGATDNILIFDELEGKAGEVKWLEKIVDEPFKATRLIAEDTVSGMGTRIGDILIDERSQRPDGSGRTLTVFFSNGAQGNEVKFDEIPAGGCIRMEVEFVKDCTFRCRLLSEAAKPAVDITAPDGEMTIDEGPEAA